LSKVEPAGMNPISNRTLDLRRLRGGIPALTAAVGSAMTEACMICFEEQSHKSGVELIVRGSFEEIFTVTWPGRVTDNMRRFWRDEDEATEYAAYGIALLLIEELTGYTAFERANKGLGFDFWLGYDHYPVTRFDPSVQHRARLEVSGIRRGSKQQVATRVKQKKTQTDVSNGEYPAFIVVVEFGAPVAEVVKK